MIKNAFSKTQIDRLGDRLKGGSHTESDLRLLDDYRRSFGEAYEAVVRTLRQRGEVPTGRLAKSTVSIAEKLRRESIRLSQMQDIAGCRIVVGNVVEQEQLVASLKTDFPGATLIDRRDNPSFGYRAIHVIAVISGKPIEIQVRSSLQHMWAEVSEKSSDVLDPTIKYGGGSDVWRNFLTVTSESVAACEELEKEGNAFYERVKKTVAELAAHEELEKKANAIYETAKKADAALPELHEFGHELQELRASLEGLKGDLEGHEQVNQETRRKLVRLRNVIADLLSRAISDLDKLKGEKQ